MAAIQQITIKIHDSKSITLTLQEARDLYCELRKLFHEPVILQEARPEKRNPWHYGTAGPPLHEYDL